MIAIERIRRAQEVIAGIAVRTPLVRFQGDSGADIYLKLENLQPIHSFKLRGALALVDSLSPSALDDGILTASAGNFAQAAAWVARERGVACRVVVPDSAPQTKLDAIHRLGGETIPVSFDAWWQCMTERRFRDLPGVFLHPVEHEALMAGNGTIGLEVLEDLPDVDNVLVPWGGGGLVTGIASALRQEKPAVRIYGAEVASAAPLTASLAAGKPVVVERKPSFVDGIGSTQLLPSMWPYAQELLDGSFVATPERVAEAVCLILERNRVVAEGAGATALAVALDEALPGTTVCVVSGGNLDGSVLAQLLASRDQDQN